MPHTINGMEIPHPGDFDIDPGNNQQMYDWVRDNKHPETDQHFGCALPWLMLAVNIFNSSSPY